MTSGDVPQPVPLEGKVERESKAESSPGLPRHGPSDRKPRRGQGQQHKGKHQIEIPEDAERELGVVVSHQDKFGFIKAISRDARYFFHVSDTDGHTCPSARVSFVVAKDLTTGRDVAYDVRVLPGALASAGVAGGRGGAVASGGISSDAEQQQGAQQERQHGNGGGVVESRSRTPPVDRRSRTPPVDRRSRTPPPVGGRRGSGGSGGGTGNSSGKAPGRSGGAMTWGEEKAARAAAAAAAALGGKEGQESGRATPQRGGPFPSTAKDSEAAEAAPGAAAGEAGEPAGKPSSDAAVAAPADAEDPSSATATPSAPADSNVEAAAGPAGGQPQWPKAAGRGSGQPGGPQQYANFGGGGGSSKGQQQGQGRPKKAREERLPGKRQGSVAQVARGARSVHLDDGVILYRDPDGLQYEAKYGNYRLTDGSHQLEVGNQVDFEVVVNPSTGARRAINVRFIGKSIAPSPSLEVSMAAALATPENGSAASAHPQQAHQQPQQQPAQQHDEGPQPAIDAPAPLSVAAPVVHVVTAPAPGRQLGRVALLKKEFGFIRQMERPGDLFFHFSQLQGIPPAELKVGEDVEYTVQRDGQDGRLSAIVIRRAPPGAVVFDVISEATYRGVVLEKPAPTKQYGQTSGLLEYVPPEGGAKTKITFAAADAIQLQPMRTGDHVSFRIATNLQAAKAAARSNNPLVQQHAGRRAVEVSLVRLAGMVVATKSQFGFITYKEPAGGSETERKVFFHNNEVVGGVQLKPGDEVAFVLHTHTKTGELNAQRVSRTKEAPEDFQLPETELPDRNPNQVKFVGNLAGGEHKKQAQPKGPDGTRGFSMGRGKGLPPQAGLVLHPLAPGSAALGAVHQVSPAAAAAGALGTAASPFAAAAGHAASSAHPGGAHQLPPLLSVASASLEVSEAAIDATKLEVLRTLASGGQRRSLSGPLNPSAVSFVPRTFSMERFVTATSELSMQSSASFALPSVAAPAGRAPSPAVEPVAAKASEQSTTGERPSHGPSGVDGEASALGAEAAGKEMQEHAPKDGQADGAGSVGDALADDGAEDSSVAVAGGSVGASSSGAHGRANQALE